MADNDPDKASPPDEQPDRPYHAKRPHKKSRKGCKNCKVRKVKCDEVRPTCRSCRLRKVECVYSVSSPPQAESPDQYSDQPQTQVQAQSPPRAQLPSTPDFFPAQPSSTFALAGSQSPYMSTDGHSPLMISGDQSPYLAFNDPVSPIVVTEPLFLPSPAQDYVDMKLLWFYTTTTYTSFSVEGDSRAPVEDVMQNTMVRYAFESPFLLHTLLSLAGLQMHSFGQDVDLGRAMAYRAKAFEGYRKAVEEANPDTFPALVANSLLLTALSSSTFRDPNAKDLYIIDWMIVWKGIGLMIDLMSLPTLFKSGIGPLFRRPIIDLDKSAIAIPNQLLFMVSSIQPDDPDYPEIAVYYEVLKYLGSLFLSLRTEGFGSMINLRIITWFTFLPRQFVNLCREKRPRALVILAQYGMFLKIVDAVWWMSGVGDRTLRDVCKHLGPDWQHFLVVPLLAIRAKRRLELARLVLDDPSWISPLPPNSPATAVRAEDCDYEPTVFLPFDREQEAVHTDNTDSSLGSDLIFGPFANWEPPKTTSQLPTRNK